ncbi:argininosuccinate synthase [Candidatus Roizmanbacteria bacterium CG2_30_33_16]|uniref:Argininosuccinate synthase n=3 Tax=Candidatus Roizmaniibacteriota TaxID=1752723 RepID=A0A2H0C4G9_9BACT|nr:argininosuccinate synthase [Candidatus Roizmanbacteria bacterium]OIP84135.1 MAG: argininosuccinate synthase [Candidatus Roizmanbacteria bacterium CG2_30_33_16]PIP64817.1 MAG: argininosuccinate synthase [Candidatus Roizmanbacteria bacterium CG22_combo_CG10-13_8_21_14_all_33_16]PIX69554.1 MAG: argininosuccinate synthase [Candidatus Roizmanbacteria bacterium CG_4_10_14_3_um_filter_33_21]
MLKKQEYVKVSSYEGKKGEVKKVVLLYSGGLDTSVMLKWIQDEYKAEVIALTIDIGQQADDLIAIKKKAIKLGAIKAFVIDVKDEFAEQYIAKGIKANASYQGKYHLSTPIGRPLLAKIAVKIAAEEGADCIAHGCTGKGNDQVRIEGTALALNPNIKIIAPVREWSMGRDEELAYAKKHHIPVKQTVALPYSYDDNMWGVTGEGGEIENPALIPPLDKILSVCVLPESAPDKPQLIELEFVKGLPVAIDKKHMKLADLIIELNKIGAKHGVGIIHHIEDRVVGIKVRGVYEAPAAEIIITAHFNLEKYVSTRYENEFKSIVDTKWAYICYAGLWLEPLMDDLNAYINRVNQKVTGKVTLKLYKGTVEAVAVDTPNTIFEEKLATFMAVSTFNQNASPGFIELFTLQMRTAQRSEKTVLLSIGKRKNKIALVHDIKKLADLKFKIYSTYKTHKFLKTLRIESMLVNKISQPQLKPNLFDLLQQNRFDLIINIPTAKKITEKENTDGKIIRQQAIKHKAHLITNVDVAKEFINKLSRHEK